MKQLNFLYSNKDQRPKEVPEQTRKLKLFVDGASRGNPGKASVGMVCLDAKTPIFQEDFYLGIATNNVAEYTALLTGLCLIKENFKNQKFELEIFSDSQLMVRQILGKYKIKNETLLALKNLIDNQLKSLSWEIKHVERSKNKSADAMANQAFISKKALPAMVKQLLRGIDFKLKQNL